LVSLQGILEYASCVHQFAMMVPSTARIAPIGVDSSVRSKSPMK
jgi:hypothetical protein